MPSFVSHYIKSTYLSRKKHAVCIIGALSLTAGLLAAGCGVSRDAGGEDARFPGIYPGALLPGGCVKHSQPSLYTERTGEIWDHGRAGDIRKL